MRFTKSGVLSIAAISVSVLAIGTTGASAAGLIGHGQLRDGAVHSDTVRNGTLQLRDMAPLPRNMILNNKGDQGPAGPRGATGATGPAGLSRVQADTPYGSDSGLPDTGLVQSADKIDPHSTASVWVACHGNSPVALGGGFILGSAGDYKAGGQSLPGVSVLSSVPAYVENGALSYNAPITDQTIGSFRPNAWAVSVSNDSDSQVVVRPSLVCGAVPKAE